MPTKHSTIEHTGAQQTELIGRVWMWEASSLIKAADVSDSGLELRNERAPGVRQQPERD